MTWRSVALDASIIVLSPVAAWLLFGIAVMSQDNYVDPWFYTGYGREFDVLHSLFGWPYYSVRFPVIILNELFAWEAPNAGFVALRYVLVLACGIPLYIWARRSFGRDVAVLSYLFLFCSPLLPRVLLWDLTTFVSVPMALAGMGIWIAGPGRPLGRVLSGVCFTAAVASHVFTGTAVAAFLVVQLVRRLRARELRGLILMDGLMTAAGVALCAAVGCAFYYARTETFTPRMLYAVTISVLEAGQAYTRAHSTPFSTWAATEYNVYIPAFCVALSGVLLGRRLIANTTTSAVWWFTFLYTGYYLVSQFVIGSFILQTFYYFAHLTVVVFLLVPIIVSELLAAARPLWGTAAGLAPLSALVAVPLANNLAPATVEHLQWLAYGNMLALTGFLAAGALLVAGSRFLAARASEGIAAAVTFLVLVQSLLFVNPAHRIVFDSRHRLRETGVYQAAIDMLSVFSTYATPQRRVMLWYCPREASLGSIASTVLLYTVHNPFSDAPAACNSEIGDYERKQLTSFPVRYVLMLDEGGLSFGARDVSLQREGFATRQVLTRRIGTEAYHAQLRVVEISREGK